MNYRHQADACHAYQIMLKSGVKAENIILMMQDCQLLAAVCCTSHEPPEFKCLGGSIIKGVGLAGLGKSDLGKSDLGRRSDRMMLQNLRKIPSPASSSTSRATTPQM